MSGLLTLPILLPLTGAALILAGGRFGLFYQRAVSLVFSAAGAAVATVLVYLALSSEIRTSAIGGWPAPYGIVLVLDRLAALMLLLTGVVGLAAVSHAVATSTDRAGAYFHALFQFQLAGLAGAFLTGDLFNLFVFFEMLLIASFALLLHGGRAGGTRATLRYVALNLTGSILFLAAAGLFYGIAGTLNLADLGLAVHRLPAGDVALLGVATMLVMVVFSLKAALAPLHFWLPGAYTGAIPAVAALFALLTKVGVYGIIRVFTLVWGEQADNLAGPWLLPAALLTLAAGAVGAVAARTVQSLLAYLVVASVGTLMTGIARFGSEGLAASLFYLVHTTVVSAGMFLLTDLLSRQRGTVGDRIVPGSRLARPVLTGTLFAVGAIALAGLPPFSGFVGKAWLLQATQPLDHAAWVWVAVLGTGLLKLLVLSRAGSTLFWKTGVQESVSDPGGATFIPAVVLIGSSPLLVLFGGPVAAYTSAAAVQLSDAPAYVAAVIGPEEPARAH